MVSFVRNLIGTGPLAAGLVLALAGAPALAQQPAAPAAPAAQPEKPAEDKVVATVDGVQIRESDLAVAEEDVGQNLTGMLPMQRRDYLVTYLTDLTLVAKAAEAKKIADSDDFKRRLAYQRNKVLMESLLGDIGKEAVSEETMKKIYDEEVKKLEGQTEIRARHILVESEDKAKELLAQIKAGKNFEELAKANSKDSSAAQGGDLGFFSKGQMVAPFETAAFALKAGEVSDVVKTDFGFHIIKVEEVRPRAAPPYDQVKTQIATYLVRKSQADLVKSLRDKAKIERANPPAPPPAPAPAAPAAPAPAAPKN